MPKIKYEEPRRMTARTRETIEAVDQMVTDYMAQGYDLTLRQVHYQMVSKQPCSFEYPNTEKSYKSLGDTVRKGRMYGMIDWDAIVDRTREVKGNSHWQSPVDIIDGAAAGYRLDKWDGQDHRVEVWVEKDALVGVVEQACRKLDNNFLSVRGYGSASAMWRASERLKGHERMMRQTHILHLGDHDPSGIDMTRDIRDRLATFGAHTKVNRIALNMDQIEEYQPIPNPTKLTDSRADGYIEEFGVECWELDALEPSVLVELIADEVDPYIDRHERDRVVAEEQRGRDLLDKVALNWDEVVELVDRL